MFGPKCAVYEKFVSSEIEKLEIRCVNHPEIFSHVKCDPTLKKSIRELKQKIKKGSSLEYKCPNCKSNKRSRNK